MANQPGFEPLPQPGDANYPHGPVEDAILAGPDIVKESKAGYKTTEFWASLVTSVLVVADGIPVPDKYKGFVVAGISALYALSRGLAKQGVPVVEPENK